MGSLCLEAVSFDANGAVALVASTLTGRTWDGSVWAYGSLSELSDMAPEILPIIATTMPSGGSDVCWVKEDVVATAMDSGDVLLWKHGSLGHSLQRLSAIGCHDSMVLGMDGPEGSILLTHGGDGGVTLINVGEEKVASQYQAHVGWVWRAVYQSGNSSVFATTGQDGCVKVWDTRSESAPVRLREGGMVARALAWSRTNEHVLATGYENGSVSLLDVRSPKEDVMAYEEHSRAVHRMIFSSTESQGDWLASVSNDTTVHVQDVAQNVSRYHSVEHSDFVHGLAQDPLSGAMVTCSWDGRVVTHHVGVDAGEEDVGGAKMDSDK